MWMCVHQRQIVKWQFYRVHVLLASLSCLHGACVGLCVVLIISGFVYFYAGWRFDVLFFFSFVLLCVLFDLLNACTVFELLNERLLCVCACVLWCAFLFLSPAPFSNQMFFRAFFFNSQNSLLIFHFSFMCTVVVYFFCVRVLFKKKTRCKWWSHESSSRAAGWR